jgi:hypothetical protein
MDGLYRVVPYPNLGVKFCSYEVMEGYQSQNHDAFSVQTPSRDELSSGQVGRHNSSLAIAVKWL